MDSKTFQSLINNPQNISTESLEKVCDKFPYFQGAKALLLKTYFEKKSYKYNNFLKKTAMSTVDRAVLFDFITDFNFENGAIPKEIEFENNIAQENLEIGSPITFQKNEGYSFNQWLQLSGTKPLENIEKAENKNKADSNLFKNSDLIDQFIETNPTIKPISKESKPSQLPEISYNEEELMTETLAKVYLEQKKFNKAIQAYQILILKYPEKSGLFADLIKEIEYLKNK